MDEPVTILSIVFTFFSALIAMIRYYQKMNQKMTETMMEEFKRIAKRNLDLEVENQVLRRGKKTSVVG